MSLPFHLTHPTISVKSMHEREEIKSSNKFNLLTKTDKDHRIKIDEDDYALVSLDIEKREL